MDHLKNKLNIIIAIICIILFGVLYIDKINRREVIPAVQTVKPAASPQAVDAREKPEEKPQEKQKTETAIKVYIMGAVAKPGVYELESGSRIVDALAAAGGESDDADLEQINLAKILQDEMQIKIPRVGGAVDKTEATVQNDNSEESDKDRLVNINAAGKSELMSLPGVGEVTAGNIIAYREANGSFENVDAIKNVNRIGDKTFEGIKDLITAE